jgi:hypothetical protein
LHSTHKPMAINRNRLNSAAEGFGHPSTMFGGIDRAGHFSAVATVDPRSAGVSTV